MNRKGSAAIIATLVIVVIAAIAGYFVWKHIESANTPVETENAPAITSSTASIATTTAGVTTSTIDTFGWQTYTNQQYGFSVQYPPFATATTTDSGILFAANGWSNLYNFSVYQKSATTSLVDWFLKNYDPDNVLLPSGAYASTELNGDILVIKIQDGIAFPDSFADDYEQNGPVDIASIYMSSPDGNEVVGMSIDEQVDWWKNFGYSDVNQLRDAILSTFQFLPSGFESWSSYVNSYFDFSFQFPPGWTISSSSPSGLPGALGKTVVYEPGISYPVFQIIIYPVGYHDFSAYDEPPGFLQGDGVYDFYFTQPNGNISSSLINILAQVRSSFISGMP